MTIQKNSQILVHVEEALADLIVVSYSSENKKFQGVLLDSNKGNLPFGVYSLNPAFSKSTSSTDNTGDKLHSASQRFTYQEPQYATENPHKPKKNGPKAKPQQKQKMTVRLRPRKVLCSNCKGICNENSENVDVSKKRKLDSDDDTAHDNIESTNSRKKYLEGNSLIPRISRLQPSEISNAIKGSSKNSNKTSEKSSVKVVSSHYSPTKEMAFVSVSSDGESKDPKDPSFTSMFQSARTLKICFGEGEGTVVKIPPITGDYNEDSGVSCDMAKPSKPDLKAAKKALKKAKKQAKKNTITIKTVVRRSPKHIGALSPRNNVSNSPHPTVDPLEKKQKHKAKHKKKHKFQKTRDENVTESESINYFSDIKEHCLKQKLSISLRRLSSNSYERRNEQDIAESGSDDWESDLVPNFPATEMEGAGARLMRFNKKKRGAYKEAVKMATIEAKMNESSQDPLASPTQSNLVNQSPKPIDVFS
ncbi:uncharacterized protein LOC125229536 isoform X2 [Leguminivora glycinivorella]|uniref:uncharacterized protein LOC125229536 isoform X2 n=1 Tax=Leguminivora glycinivorella TaxID=1035111 RepID=UPI00200DAA2B|nr:uncharacterized protein LOC125229536 isoform X2 [Leguminivora glycinivorella]